MILNPLHTKYLSNSPPRLPLKLERGLFNYQFVKGNNQVRYFIWNADMYFEIEIENAKLQDQNTNLNTWKKTLLSTFVYIVKEKQIVKWFTFYTHENDVKISWKNPPLRTII